MNDGQLIFSGGRTEDTLRTDVVFRLGDNSLTQLAGPPHAAWGSDGAEIPGWSQRRAILSVANPAGPYLVSATATNESGRPVNAVTYQGIGDSLRLLIDHSGQRPGPPDGTNFTNTSAFTLRRVNRHGDVVIGGKLKGGSATEFVNDPGIWVSQSGQLDLLYRQGDPIPGAAVGELFGPLPARVDSGISLNDAVDVAFTSGICEQRAANVVFVRRH